MLTILNPTMAVMEDLKTKLWEKALYAVIGSERAPTTGTPHIHAYVLFAAKKRLQEVRGQVTEHGDWRIVTPNAESIQRVIEYVQKDDNNPIIIGHQPVNRKGHRSDIEEGMKCATMQEIAEKAPTLIFKYPSGCRLWVETHQAMQIEDKIDFPKTIIWNWGPTGTGKTHTAWHTAGYLPRDIISFTGDINTYLRGYHGQKVAILEDLREEDCKFNRLLQLTDNRRMIVGTFFAQAYWVPEVIIITAPYSPNQMYGRKFNIVTKQMEDNGDIA